MDYDDYERDVESAWDHIEHDEESEEEREAANEAIDQNRDVERSWRN